MIELGSSAGAVRRTSWSQRIARVVSPYWLRSADRVGREPVVTGRPHLENWGSLRIGDDFELYSRPAQSHVMVLPGGSIEIGDRVVISYGAAISSQIEVRIGDDSKVGPYVVIMDSDFHVAGDRNAIARPAPVSVGRGVVIGSRVTILRGSEIGDGAVVQSGSVVSGRVAPGAVVGGVPARSVTEVGSGSNDVGTLVMRVLGLTSLPDALDGPAEIPQWDSLGALKLLLALEEAFGIDLGPEDVTTARSVARLSEVVESARQRRDAGSSPT